MGFFFGGDNIYYKHLDMLPNDNIKHYTKRDIQEIYNISLSKINKEIAAKKLGIIKIGKSVRIPRNELFKWLKKYNPTPVAVWFTKAKCIIRINSPLPLHMEQLNFRQKKELDILINQMLFKPNYRLKKYHF